MSRCAGRPETTHILLPLITQSPSAFFLAVVLSAKASLPLDSSERAKLPSCSRVGVVSAGRMRTGNAQRDAPRTRPGAAGSAT